MQISLVNAFLYFANNLKHVEDPALLSKQFLVFLIEGIYDLYTIYEPHMKTNRPENSIEFFCLTRPDRYSLKITYLFVRSFPRTRVVVGYMR